MIIIINNETNKSIQNNLNNYKILIIIIKINNKKKL